MEYLSAMERSPVNSLEIRVLLKKALTSKTDDRQVYVCGLQRSYIFENMSEYDVSKFKNRSNIQENDSSTHLGERLTSIQTLGVSTPDAT